MMRVPVPMPVRLTLADQTVVAIEALLAVLPAGAVLPCEDALAVRFSVSRVTVRKALARLVARGMVAGGGRGKRRVVVGGAVGAGGKAGVRPTVVNWLSPVAETELVWSTREAFEVVRTVLGRKGYVVVFRHLPVLWGGRPQRSLEALEAEADKEPAGWILYRATAVMQRWFEGRGLPSLVVGPCHEGVRLPAVLADVEALGRHAVAEAARRGHRHVGFVVDDPAVASASRTLEGLLGGALGVRISVIRDDGTVSGLREELHGALRSAGRPTCLLVAEADAVLAVAGLVREAGLRVPEDVSLVVRDHEPFLNRSVPEFSRYQFDWQRFGRAVVQLLESVMGGGPGDGTQRVLMPEFIRGETLARAAVE